MRRRRVEGESSRAQRRSRKAYAAAAAYGSGRVAPRTATCLHLNTVHSGRLGPQHWPARRAPARRTKESDDVEAPIGTFSDGVFAITLLILNVHLDRQHELTLDALRNLVPDVFAFVLSSVIVGVYWVSRHNMPHLIKAVDRRLLWLNLVLLLVIVFIAFPAALLGQHLGNPIAVIL